MNEFEIIRHIQLLIKIEENKIKSRNRFERDIFISLSVLIIAVIAIMVSCFKIEKYLEEIMKCVIAIEYK